MSLRVFVSYSSLDRAEALAVRRILEGAGCEVWLDVFDIRPAGRLESELTEALERADLVCVLLSPTSVVSPWVREELAAALAGTARGQRLLPVILRPCELPPELDGLVGIDAQDGPEADHVRLRLLRAVLGEAAAPDPLLDEAYRRALAGRAEVLAAVEPIPKVMDDLAGVWRTPIRQLQISVNPRAVPEGSLLELRFSLEHDDLFTAPACFFFARAREGRTWPPEIRFEEPPPGHFRFGQARLDAKMRWIDRVVSLDQSLHAPRFRDDPASFRLDLDGSDWRPDGLQLRRAYEFPALAKLVADRAYFSLTLHDVAARTARTVDPEKTDLGLTVTASLPGEVPHRPVRLRLFKTGHGPLERRLLGTEYLTRFDGPIQREVVLARLPAARGRAGEETRGERESRLRRGEIHDDVDRRDAASVSLLDAGILRNRGRAEAADRELTTAIERIWPFVMENPAPDRDDGALLCRALQGRLDSALAALRTDPRAAAQVSHWGDLLVDVRRHLARCDPEDLDNRDTLAYLLFLQAEEHAAAGRAEPAARVLAESVDRLREVYRARAGAETGRRLARTLREAAAFAGSARLPGLPLADWATEAARLEDLSR